MVSLPVMVALKCYAVETFFVYASSGLKLNGFLRVKQV